MKHYRIEPTHKKSVIEIATFRRPLEELTGNDEDKGRWGYLRKELGWRWGSFMISVPDTDEEIKEIVKKERKKRKVKIADSDLSEFME